MSQEKTSLANKFGENLDILLRKPQGKKKLPCVILVQGIGMDMHEWKNSHDEIAKRLVHQNFATVQFNFSYQKNVTDTLDSEIGLAKRAKELEDVIAWTVKNPHLDPVRVGIYAMSFGVSTVLLTSLHHIRSLCLTCGIGFRPENYIKRYLNRGDTINKDGETRLTRSSGKTMIVQADFWPSLENLRQEELVAKLRIPVFVVHGNLDEYVTNDDMQCVYGAIKSRGKKLKVYNGAHHGFDDAPKKIHDEFLHDVLKWFKTTLI